MNAPYNGDRGHGPGGDPEGQVPPPSHAQHNPYAHDPYAHDPYAHEPHRQDPYLGDSPPPDPRQISYTQLQYLHDPYPQDPYSTGTFAAIPYTAPDPTRRSSTTRHRSPTGTTR
ncbi:hypothetical protein NKH77_26665 [Streptomyces sp. M19]